MTEVLAKARESIKAAVEAEIVAVMAKAIEAAKASIADEVLDECSEVLDSDALRASIVEACKSFDFSDHVSA